MLENTLPIGEHLIDPIALHTKTCRAKRVVTGLIPVSTMLTAVHLDDQPAREADEIRDGGTDRFLTSQLVVGLAAVLEEAP